MHGLQLLVMNSFPKISNSHQQVEMVNIVIFQKLDYIAQVDERDFDVAGLADILKHCTRTNFLS